MRHKASTHPSSAVRIDAVNTRLTRVVIRYSSLTSAELAILTDSDESNLNELVARAREGSDVAFDALASRVRDRVRGWARRLTVDHDDAEDVAQLVLLRLHQQVTAFEGRSRFTTWLYAVTTRVALSRRAKQRRRERLTEGRAHELTAAVAADPVPGDDAFAGDSDAVRLALLVPSYLDVLSGREREIFELGDLRGFNSTEIAERLGVKAVTVRTQLMRARRKIRLRMLEEHPALLEGYNA